MFLSLKSGAQRSVYTGVRFSCDKAGEPASLSVPTSACH